MSNPGEIVTPEMLSAQSSLDSWGMAKPTKEVQLPSGVNVRVRELDIPSMIQIGILDKMDSFTPKVLDDGKKKRKKVEENLATDPKRMADLVEVLDKVVAHCVVSPKLQSTPEDGVFKEGVRYAAQIPMGDKMAVFQAAFSGMDEFFRLGGEQTADLGSVAKVEDVQSSSE